jgi:hypothetical protein
MKNKHAFAELVQCPKTTDRHDNAAARIDARIKCVRNHFYLQPERRVAFDALVAILRSRTALVRPTPGPARPGWSSAAFLINRLRNLAERESQWLRSPHDWRPAGASLRLEFRSLAGHLLALYPVPAFMDSVWDLSPGHDAFRQQVWWIRLARGASFRDLNLPLPLTRRMEHYIRQSPDHYTAMQALRYGETLAFGGNIRLAREIAASRLGQKIEHSAFWRTVLLFFANHPEMDRSWVIPIIDFIQASKFAGEPIVTAHGAGQRQAPWPDFSIKGRTPASMMRLVREWHGDVTSKNLRDSFSWPASNIQAFRFVEDCDETEHQREWTIHELLTSPELYLEGRTLRHCVFTYAPKCRRGETTIWSLRLRTNQREKRMATIEVNPRKGEVIQTRAKANSYAGERSKEMIRRWAEAAGLHINPRSW